MFNPEKILGGLIKGGLGGGHGMGAKAAIGLGMLGIAMEAIEHFANQQRMPQPGAAPPPPPGGTAQAPPPSPSTSAAGTRPPVPPPPSTITPPPMAAPSISPPGPQTVPPLPPTSATLSDAVLLIRSMIAAAYADGRLDDSERTRIMEKLAAVGLTEEERQFILRELASPTDLDAIINAVNTPALAQQIYAVSLLAIEVDTEEERTYLKTLAKRLYLSDAMVARIHQDLGLTLP